MPIEFRVPKLCLGTRLPEKLHFDLYEQHSKQSFKSLCVPKRNLGTRNNHDA